ncbi:MAG: thioesterase family protein [Bacillota bacterium]|nr:thioesterase family protein [Bacillota bacterium]
MGDQLAVGIIGNKEELVTGEKTALAVGSGKLKVYATPCMVALMEGAAVAALEGKLEYQMDTVGTSLEILHMAATPVGMKVKAEAKLINIDGRKLTFEIEAFDDREKIGSGIHQRFMINGDKFLEKCLSKLEG